MTPKEKKLQIDLIKKAYSALEFLDNLTHTPYRIMLYNMIYNAEKKHRKFRPDRIDCGISIANAAKLFAIKYIAESLTNKMLTIKDILHIRTECFYAQSIAENYHAEILEKWHGLDIESLVALDYSELMQ